MATPTDPPPLRGGELLDALSAVMVGFHERYHGRPPACATAMMMEDDLLVCVLRGVYTDVEKTLIEVQRGSLVKEGRRAFQAAMQPRLVREVERLSGRHVNTFISNSHTGPDLEIQLFFLDPAA